MLLLFDSNRWNCVVLFLISSNAFYIILIDSSTLKWVSIRFIEFVWHFNRFSCSCCVLELFDNLDLNSWKCLLMNHLLINSHQLVIIKTLRLLVWWVINCLISLQLNVKNNGKASQANQVIQVILLKILECLVF